jgi:hypothetical protein
VIRGLLRREPVGNLVVGLLAVAVGLALSVLGAVEGDEAADALLPLAFVAFGAIYMRVMTESGRRDER